MNKIRYEPWLAFKIISHKPTFFVCCSFVKDYQVIISQERVVVENSSWLCVVPYWAVWPYETMLLPKRHVLRIEDLSDTERNGQ